MQKSSRFWLVLFLCIAIYSSVDLGLANAAEDGSGSVPDGQCDSEGDAEGNCEDSGFVISRVLRLKLDGLDGRVTLPNLLYFPKYQQPGESINIIRQIAGSKVTKEFGTNLLQDDDGTEMGLLSEKYSDPVKILTEAFEMWIRGKAGQSPRTWRTLVRCLREERLTILADNIENYLPSSTEITSSFEIPSLWKNKDEERFRMAFQLLQKVRFIVDTMTSHLEKAGTKLEEISSELNRLITRLLDQNVRIGIIGLTKAGKSTFLNALLGRSFLPSSVQPQTANETVIIHDMSKPDGELYCTVDQKRFRLASGQDKIYQKLLGFNKENRNKGETSEKCDKLILYAPLKFLASGENKGVKLELSDTPGFGEAGAKKAATLKVAVKELCAFILILNSDYLKSEAELKLLKELMEYHPELFSELNRVLILVNGHQNLYSEGKYSSDPDSLTPAKVPLYVSDYIRKHDFLDIRIPPEKIILFNALWALRSRVWRVSSILEGDLKQAKTLYDEAILMLRFINQDDKADAIEEEMSEENINTAISLLEPLSKIEIIENRLREMVVENGGTVLLESAIDDTVSVIKYSLFPTITKLVDNEEVESKQNELQAVSELDELFNSLFSDGEAIFNGLYSLLASSTQAHVTTLRDTVQESLANVASSKLMEGLGEIVQLEDKNKVIAEMRGARDAIPSAALIKMKSEWLTLSDTIRSAAADQMRKTFSDLKASFLSSLSRIDKGAKDSNLYRLTEHLVVTVPTLLVAASDSSLVPASSSLAIDKLVLSDSAAIQDDAIAAYMQEGKKQKFNTKERKKCGSRFLFWGGGCVHFTEAIPYDQPVFSPKINAFKSAFDDVVDSWMNLYDEQVESFLRDISKSTGDAGKAKLKSILEEPWQRVTKMLRDSQSAFEKAQQNVSFLKEKKEKLKEFRKALSDSLKK